MILYATDIHLTDKQPTNRLTDIVAAGLNKFEYILAAAHKQHSSIILGGDLFNGACPSYNLLTSVIALIKKYPDVNIYTIYGNHDIIQTNVFGDNAAIHALTKSGLIKHLDKTQPTEIDGFNVFGLDYTKEMVNEFMIPDIYDNTILVTHLPLFPNKQVFDTISLADFKTNAKYVLCSHIHNQFNVDVNNVKFINPGPVCRLKRTEKDDVPSYYLFHDNQWSLETIPHEKAEFRTKDECPEDVEDLENYAKIEAQDVMGVLKSHCESDKIYEACVGLIEKHTT